MLPQRAANILSSEITPRSIFDQRRRFLGTSIGLGLSAMLPLDASAAIPGALGSGKPSEFSTFETPTPLKHVSGYNNFYEFGTDKEDPALEAYRLKTKPWTVSIEGLVKKPITLAMDDILKLAALEERIYRMRCVEGWSMVILE